MKPKPVDRSRFPQINWILRTIVIVKIAKTCVLRRVKVAAKGNEKFAHWRLEYGRASISAEITQPLEPKYIEHICFINKWKKRIVYFGLIHVQINIFREPVWFLVFDIHRRCARWVNWVELSVFRMRTTWVWMIFIHSQWISFFVYLDSDGRHIVFLFVAIKCARPLRVLFVYGCVYGEQGHRRLTVKVNEGEHVITSIRIKVLQCQVQFRRARPFSRRLYRNERKWENACVNNLPFDGGNPI